MGDNYPSNSPQFCLQGRMTKPTM